MNSTQPLNIQGRLKFLHGQSRQRGDSSPPQLALFAIATPLQPPAILEIRTKNMIFRTKHKLDFTPMACDAKCVELRLEVLLSVWFWLVLIECFPACSGVKSFWATPRQS